MTVYGSPAWAALIAQIRKDPRALALRDVAADYLIEHGDPRGEFIVLRNRLAAGNVPSAEYVAVYDRHRELERAQPWKAQLAKLAMTWVPPFTGFIEEATIAREGLVRFGELCRHEPITQLVGNGFGELSSALLETPELDEIEQLGLAEDAASMFASPRLTNVRTVHAARGPRAYFEKLAASVVRPHVLQISNMLTSRDHDELAMLGLLARSPVLDELRELPRTTDGIVAVFADHELAHLERLDTTRLSRATVERLAPRFDQLRSLRVGDNAALVLPIVQAHVASGNLHELTLVIREPDGPAVVELIDSAACLQLRKIAIRGLPLPVPLEQALCRLAYHGHLQEVLVNSRRGARIEIPGAHVIEAS